MFAAQTSRARPTARTSTGTATALAALDRAQLKKTPQRIAIVRAFIDDVTHPTAQILFEKLRKTLPTMSFATVYNTLGALERAGMCRALRLEGEAGASGIRFDPNGDPHDHVACDTCGAVRDIALPSTSRDRRGRRLGIARVAGVSCVAGDVGVAALEGFRLRTVERVYRGECAACQAKAQECDRVSFAAHDIRVTTKSKQHLARRRRAQSL
ncbi:MAG: hypothetical protein NVSMB1_03430 [Polyangiales bacterium]